MRAVAKTTLDMEAKDGGLTLGEAYEIYLLPPMTRTLLADSIAAALTSEGWELLGSPTDSDWWLTSRGQQRVMVYLMGGKKESSLYLAEVEDMAATNPATPPDTAASATTTDAISEVSPAPVPAEPAAREAGTYSFSTTHFDDGWTSTVHDDYVLVDNGYHSVYLLYHVPYNASQFSGTGLRDAEYYWDNYVTKYFQTDNKQFNDAGQLMKPGYMEGHGREKRTGQPCFIGMYLLIVPNATSLVIGSTPDESSFRKLFPKANEFAGSDLAEMERYNKFAVGAADIVGTWQNGNTETAQWYYTSPAGYEGYAGMTLAATSATFLFNSNGTYASIHNGATGAVGSMSTFQQEYKGTYTVSDWAITATNRWQGQTAQFDAYFEAVRGGRVLHLDDGGTRYSLVRRQE